mmetsp:Transcript_36188/g.59436  ORF Transcript_36188/g.59436 Transcript_36188/m.59436 type:complete len:367 (-) Transcript_36188:31-1131(-)
MWPHGNNCSFLTGILDYFTDIQQNQLSAIRGDDEQQHLHNLCDSLQSLITCAQRRTATDTTQSQSSPSRRTTTAGGADEKAQSLDDESIQKFLEWSETYISICTETSANANHEEETTTRTSGGTNWPQLVELFNFQFPHYSIPTHVDVSQRHTAYLCQYCKEKGNELMKHKQIKNAIEMYSKAIALLESGMSGASSKSGSKPPPAAKVTIATDSDGGMIATKDKAEDKDKEKEKENEKAIIYCNRSAAYVYLQQYENAVQDAVCAIHNDPLLTKAWIRKGMAEQELQRYQIAYGDYQVALNQSQATDNYYKFLNKKIKQCFEKILSQHQQQSQSEVKSAAGAAAFAESDHAIIPPAPAPVANHQDL